MRSILVCILFLFGTLTVSVFADTNRVTLLKMGASLGEVDGRVIVRSLLDVGAAKKAGLRVGDQILGINDSPIESLSMVQSLVSSDTKLTSLVVERNSEEMLLLKLTDVAADVAANESQNLPSDTKLLSVDNLTAYAREQISRATGGTIPTPTPQPIYVAPARELVPTPIPVRRSSPSSVVPPASLLPNRGVQYRIQPQRIVRPIPQQALVARPIAAQPRTVTSVPFNTPASFNLSTPSIRRGGWLQRMRGRRGIVIR